MHKRVWRAMGSAIAFLLVGLAGPALAQTASAHGVRAQVLAPGLLVQYAKGKGAAVRRYVSGKARIDVSARTGPDGPVALIVASTPGLGQASVVGGSGYVGAVARFSVGRLDAKADGDGLVVTSPDGGRATRYDYLEPLAGRWTHIDGGSWDGDSGYSAPKDVDGDGVIDIVQDDDRFLYIFADYASSEPPSRIFNLVAGKVVDVSAEPRYVKFYRVEAARAEAGCLKDRSNGVCASFVADAARAGELAQAWAVMLKAYDRHPDPIFLPIRCDVTVAPGGDCPAAKAHPFHTFPAALAWFLTRNGVVKASTMKGLPGAFAGPAG